MAVLTPAVQQGQVFIPMHYDETNQLTDAVFDPYSRQPSYKACASADRPPPADLLRVSFPHTVFLFPAVTDMSTSNADSPKPRRPTSRSFAMGRTSPARSAAC